MRTLDWPKAACFNCKGEHPIVECTEYSARKAAGKLKGHVTAFDNAKQEYIRAKRAAAGSARAILLGQEIQEASASDRDPEPGEVRTWGVLPAACDVPRSAVQSRPTTGRFDAMVDEDSEKEDEDNVVANPEEAFTVYAVQEKKRMAPMPKKKPESQRKAEEQLSDEKAPGERLSPKQKHVVAAIRKEDIRVPLPDDGVTTDKILCLHDSGSAPHAASKTKHVPGALLSKSTSKQAQARYTAANGTEVENSSFEMAIPFTSDEGNKGEITFQDADVDTPIISTGKLVDADLDSYFPKKGGKSVNTPSEKDINVFRCHGVYLLLLHVPQNR